MEWFKYTISTNEESEDLISAMLAELGITGVEIEDKRPLTVEESGGYFGDVVPEMPKDDHLALVSFYTDEKEDREAVLAKVRGGLEGLREYSDIGDGSIRTSKTADEDWINNWKQYFHAFSIDDIRIIPSWETEDGVWGETEPSEGLSESKAESGEQKDDIKAQENKAGIVLHIDPGTAFGTGKHESTQLAIRALRKYVRPGMKVLDIGTGSGILGIIALKSGASHVFGTDIDPHVPEAVRENMEKNDIQASGMECKIGDIGSDEKLKRAAGADYDIAVANIIAEILAPLTAEIPAHLKKGGLYITSGILTDHAEIVRKAMKEAGLEIREENVMGEWESIVACRI